MLYKSLKDTKLKITHVSDRMRSIIWEYGAVLH